jgi:hypothetical protein
VFRLVGAGYLVWAVSAYDAGLFVVGLLFLLLPEWTGSPPTRTPSGGSS